MLGEDRIMDFLKQNGGQKLIIIGLCPPQFVFLIRNTKKKQNPGDTSHKKNQIGLFEKNKYVFCLCFKFWSKKITINFNQLQKNKADIGSFIKFASKLVSIVFLCFYCFHVLVTFFWEFSFFII